jgi:hypothetical protein
MGACYLSRWQILTSWDASACHMSISSGLGIRNVPLTQADGVACGRPRLRGWAGCRRAKPCGLEKDSAESGEQIQAQDEWVRNG